MAQSEETEYPGVNPYLVALLVSVATFMEVLDTTIANVALRYIAGGLAVSSDEAAWVITTYLVANAIVIAASSWLVEIFGRKNFFMACTALFTISSFCCGLAWNLPSLLLFRVFQGLGGGGMTPVAQSILAAAFPPSQRARGFAIYGIAVVLAPAIGPTLGGWITDNWSWHWCFFINVPVGVGSLAAVALYLPQSPQRQERRKEMWRRGKLRFDSIGFALVALFLGSLELVLDRGQEYDWFGSTFILTFSWIAAASLFFFVPYELLRKDPLIDLRLLVSRQFGTCFIIMLLMGGVLISTTQLLPQLLQDQYGYDATLAGLVLSPGGLVTMCVFALIGRFGLFRPKYAMALGGLIVAGGMYDLTQLYSGLDFAFFAWSRIYVGIGLPLVFNSVTTASYTGLPPAKTDQASSLINVARNLGGSVGVSIAQTILARREQFHQSRLVEHVGTWNPAYNQTAQQAQHYFHTQPLVGEGAGSSRTALGWVAQQVQAQAILWSYIDVFFVLALASLAISVCALTLKRSQPGAAAVAH